MLLNDLPSFELCTPSGPFGNAPSNRVSTLTSHPYELDKEVCPSGYSNLRKKSKILCTVDKISS